MYHGFNQDRNIYQFYYILIYQLYQLWRLYLIQQMQSTISEIITYLNSHGFQFPSQRSLVESCKDMRTIWNILIALFRGIEPSYIRNILAIESHSIGEDMDKHRVSIGFMSNLLVVYEIFRLIRCEFKLNNFLRPTTASLQVALSKTIQLCRWFEVIKISNDQNFMKFQLSQREYRKLKIKLEQFNEEFAKTEERKIMEKPLFDEKMMKLLSVRESLMEERQIKSKKVEAQKLLEDEMRVKEKYLEELKYNNDSEELELAQLRQEISMNAPQIKKQKKNAEDILHQYLTTSQKQISNLKNRVNGMKMLNLSYDPQESLQAYTQVLKRRQAVSNLKAHKLRQEQRLVNLERSVRLLEGQVQTLHVKYKNQKVCDDELKRCSTACEQKMQRLKKQQKDLVLQCEKLSQIIQFLLMANNKRNEAKLNLQQQLKIMKAECARKMNQMRLELQEYQRRSQQFLDKIYSKFSL